MPGGVCACGRKPGRRHVRGHARSSAVPPSGVAVPHRKRVHAEFHRFFLQALQRFEWSFTEAILQ